MVSQDFAGRQRDQSAGCGPVAERGQEGGGREPAGGPAQPQQRRRAAREQVHQAEHRQRQGAAPHGRAPTAFAQQHAEAGDEHRPHESGGVDDRSDGLRERRGAAPALLAVGAAAGPPAQFGQPAHQALAALRGRPHRRHLGADLGRGLLDGPQQTRAREAEGFVLRLPCVVPGVLAQLAHHVDGRGVRVGSAPAVEPLGDQPARLLALADELHDLGDPPVQGAGVVLLGGLEHHQRGHRGVRPETVDEPSHQREDRVGGLHSGTAGPDPSSHVLRPRRIRLIEHRVRWGYPDRAAAAPREPCECRGPREPGPDAAGPIRVVCRGVCYGDMSALWQPPARPGAVSQCGPGWRSHPPRVSDPYPQKASPTCIRPHLPALSVRTAPSVR
ncbi:conserved hypothetical protein [Streptomyces sp. e14]|nr:conserved hypothetical protein [Streptomyces sp. e14]